MQKIFNSILIIIFLVLVGLFAYKTLGTHEVSKVSIASTSPNDENKTTPNKVNEFKFNEKIDS